METFTDKERSAIFWALCGEQRKLQHDIETWNGFKSIGCKLQLAQMRHQLRHTRRALRKFHSVFNTTQTGGFHNNDY